MLALKKNNLTHYFLGFASEASNILHIKTEKYYLEAIETIEYLFDKTEDKEGDPLHDLIDIISRSIEKYELSQENIYNFHKEADGTSQEISILRVLMNQYNLSINDFKKEIGSDSLVSMILKGTKNLTKENISKLSERFNLNPSIFFDFKIN
jgi:HTH-type transcriptional regulator/antitoxin HigA